MVSIRNINMSYKGLKALDNINLEIQPGELFGILGPDGSGKSSLFRILATLIDPDSGSATLDGLDLQKDYRKIRTRIGYMPGKFSLYQDLSVEENLQFFARVFGTTIEESYHLIEDIYVQIEPFKNRRAGALSGGMKQKLALCCALIHKPRILLLDEPGTGVDPVSRNEFWDVLKKLHKSDITILVSTPNMDEAEKCDRVALLQKGVILATDTPDNIVSAYPNSLFAARTENMYTLIQDLRAFEQAIDCYAFGEYAHMPAKTDTVNEEMIRNYLESKGHKQIKVHPVDANIEDCFIALM